MRLLHVLSLSPLFLSPALSQDLLSRLTLLGLDGFAVMMAEYNPSLVEEIGNRSDVTVWAPGNDVVAAWIAQDALVKRDDKKKKDQTAAQNTKLPPAPENDTPKPPGSRTDDDDDDDDNDKKKRQVPVDYPDTNFETIMSFLDDPEYVNLGEGDQVARFVKNQAAPFSAAVDSISHLEITTGLGDQQLTVRGPFKFSNGVIYEVNAFFTLPEPFTATMEHLDLAGEFYKLIVQTANLPLFEETPAVTIFAPIDSSYGNLTDPQSYIVTVPGEVSLYFSPDLWPGFTLTAKSGAKIDVTLGPGGEKLVNCRRLVKPNVVTKNGVIHFIDGPLYPGCNGQHNISSTGTPKPPIPTAPPTTQGAASRQGAAAGAFAAAIGAALLMLY